MERWAKEFISWCDHHKIAIPRTQEELIKLKVFEAKNKRLTSLHPNIAYLKNLYKIVLDHNLLSDLPPLPRKLTALSLSHNLLREIPKECHKLKDLHTLILRHNSITHIPQWIGDFKSLHLLDIADNKLSSLAPIQANTQLKILLVSDNKITDISPIYELDELKVFDFTDNRVTCFDKRIRNLKNLKLFSGMNNKIKDFDMLFLLKDTKIHLQLTQSAKLQATKILRYLKQRFNLHIA